MSTLIYVMLSACIVAIIAVTIRQILFSAVKFFAPYNDMYKDIVLEDLPSVTIIIPAYNEEAVIGGGIEAMLRLDYPKGKLKIMVVNDRSQDGTKEIVDSYVAKHPEIVPLHRVDGDTPGKPAALKDAIEQVNTDIIIIFDADYLPSPNLLKKLVAPFMDPEVGATMGRVIPYNSDYNNMTRLIDLERRAGYCVDQWARGRLRTTPQYGGTCGGIRMSALQDVGGWLTDVLAEDTDLTYRLYLKGWKVQYLNHAECYEEATEAWPVRYKQVRRWSMGHNECMIKYFWKIMSHGNLFSWRKLDALILLLIYFIPLLAMILMVFVPFLSLDSSYLAYAAYPITLAVMLNAVNCTPLIQTVVAAVADKQPHVLKVLPAIFLNSFINMIASADGVLRVIYSMVFKTKLKWDKTTRFRKEAKKC